MTDRLDNKPMTEAPSSGASASVPSGDVRRVPQNVPEVKAVLGGKSTGRPSVANKKRAQAAVREESPKLDLPRIDQAPRPSVSKDAPVPSQFVAEQAVIQPSVPAETDLGAKGTPEDHAPEQGASQETTSSDRPTVSEKKKRSPWFKVGVSLLAVACVVALLGTAFVCLRWGFPQDAKDIQGTWMMQGAENAVTITDTKIDLAGEAQYDYSLDTEAKAIDVAFAGLKGQSHYRFSRDRMSLAFIDGVDCSWTATLAMDMAWMWSDFIGSLQGLPSDPLGSETGIVLYRQTSGAAS